MLVFVEVHSFTSKLVA